MLQQDFLGVTMTLEYKGGPQFVEKQRMEKYCKTQQKKLKKVKSLVVSSTK